jgi:RNA polymerase sigma-70 factor (ECF subfamily)|tara:strand:+ start:4968 stop:5657 length:690 start_codon:yes stop_codon:yes gene_type:complete
MAITGNLTAWGGFNDILAGDCKSRQPSVVDGYRDKMIKKPDADQALVKRVQKGDQRAFDLLVLKYQHKVIGVVSRYVRNRADMEDIAQEAFIKAYRALPNFRGDSAFYTWLYRIAINTAKNHLVSQSRRPPATDVDAQDAEYLYGDSDLQDIQNPENLLFSEELKQVVDRAIKELPDDLRTAVTLREYDGLSYEEIAEVMECPVGTVRSRIFRGREAIENEIRPLMAGE